jgi:hypothetical protein
MRFTCVPTGTAKARKSVAVVTSNVATGLMAKATIAEDDRVDRATGNRTDVHRRRMHGPDGQGGGRRNRLRDVVAAGRRDERDAEQGRQEEEWFA